MKELIKKYEIWIFLVLGSVFNSLFVYSRAQGLIPRFLYNHGRFSVLLFFLICLVKYTRGNAGVKDIFKPMLNWIVRPKWYLFSFLFAFSIGAFTLLLKGFYSDGEFYSYLKLNYEYLTATGIVVLFVWAFLGEVVWVSYCIRELSKIMKPFYQSQIVGLSWTLWWIPIVILGEGVLPGIPIWPLSIFMLGIAGMCTLVYGHSKSGVCVLIL
ncbi:MAG: TRAP-type mannitol/chloroaromatic compound transport system permease small subunit [Glaciecola sp.]|jgi:TRAP-type mannitol/chloroaromatic compound transport system permease small subunit